MSEASTLILMLTAVSIGSILLRRLSIPLETIYIVTGIVLTPFLVDANTALFAEAGAVFLIFFTAMNIRIEPVRSYIGPSLTVILAHLLILAAAGYLCLRYGYSLHEAFIVGITCATGSSMLAIDVIENQIDRHLAHGQLTEAITVLQDLMTALLVAFLAFWPSTAESIAGIGVTGLVFLLALLGRDRIRPLLRRLSSRVEVTLLLGLAVLWTTAAAFHGIPYGIVIAPLVAGLFLSGHGDNFTLLEAIGPLKDFFVPLLLVSLGTLVLAGTGGIVLAISIFLAVMIVRPIFTAVILLWQDIEPYSSVRTAIQLDQVSELSLLLVLILNLGGQISPEVSRAIVLAAAASFITSSYTTRHADTIYAHLTGLIEDTSPQIEETGHTVIAGYGHLGRAIAPFLEDPVIIDNDPEAVRQAQEDGHTAVKRDIHDPATWHHVNATAASRIILTIPDDDTALHIADMDVNAVLLTISSTLADRLDDRPRIRAHTPSSLSSAAVIDEVASIIDDISSED